MQDFSGQTHGRMEISEKLAEGGFYTTYKANWNTMPVTLKIFLQAFSQDDDFSNHFNRKVIELTRIQHKSIPIIHDFGDIQGHKYILEQYIEGQTLSEVLRSTSQSVPLASRVIVSIGKALHYAHEKGFLHFGINPNNILIDHKEKSWLTDLGITHLIHTFHTSQPGSGLYGNPIYLSPEHIMGEQMDRRSDIYSLGLVLYEIVTGVRPFEGDSPMGIALSKVQGDPPSPSEYNPEISEMFAGVILRSIARESEKRYQTAEKMVTALNGAIAEYILTHHDF